MPSVAEQLRLAREHQKLTVEQVAELTKIRTDHIRAMDAGNFELFSAPVYARGSVRSYATAVKLNVPQVMAALHTELGAIPKFKESGVGVTKSSPSLTNRIMFALSRVNWKIAIVVVVLLLLAAGATLAYSSYKARQSRDQNLDLGPGLYVPTKTNTGETLPLPAR